MRRVLCASCLVLGAAWALPAAETNVVNGMTIVCEDGVCRVVEPGEGQGERSRSRVELSTSSDRRDEVEKISGGGQGKENNSAVHNSSFVIRRSSRLAQGYMDADAFVAFLENRPQDDFFAGKGIWLIVLLALLGGLAMNLTPCVLPMIPINLMIIGKSAKRGAWYGFGITIAYGVLGVLASVGGMAFGSIQSNPWFNLAVALVFVALAASLSGAFYIDFSKSRAKFRGGAFLMGMLAAVLAGACVAPILIAVLLLTARLFAAGNMFALGLPFVLGLGMALPWPFVGAGLAILPKPGAWMKWVNRGFALVVLCLAGYYGALAAGGFSSSGRSVASVRPSDFPAVLEKSKRPVLVDCWATWCKNCTAMEAGTLDNPKVREAMKKFAVVRLQSEDINELRKLSGFEGVMGLPAFVIFE